MISNKMLMRYKKIIYLFFVFVFVLTIIGCSKKAVDTTETTASEETASLEETTTSEQSAEDYAPETVDALTTDFEEMTW